MSVCVSVLDAALCGHDALHLCEQSVVVPRNLLRTFLLNLEKRYCSSHKAIFLPQNHSRTLASFPGTRHGNRAGNECYFGFFELWISKVPGVLIKLSGNKVWIFSYILGSESRRGDKRVEK